MKPFKTYCFITKLYGVQKSEINPEDRIWMIIPEDSDVGKQVQSQYEKCKQNGAIMTMQRTYPDNSEWLIIICSSIDIAVMITNQILGIENYEGRLICLGKFDINKENIDKLEFNLKNLIKMLQDDDDEENENDEEDNDERGSD